MTQPNNETPLDLEAIRARLKAAMQEKEIYLDEWPIFIDDNCDAITAPLAQELFNHAPTDIAALVEEVERLRAENERLQTKLDEIDELHWYNVERFERSDADRMSDFEGVGTEGD